MHEKSKEENSSQGKELWVSLISLKTYLFSCEISCLVFRQAFLKETQKFWVGFFIQFFGLLCLKLSEMSGTTNIFVRCLLEK